MARRSEGIVLNTLYEGAPRAGGYREVCPERVFAHLRGVHVIDVREPREFTDELGHIEGAELVPLATVVAAAKRWAKDADLVIVCRSGRRSGAAARVLALAGFGRVMNMVGGMLAWNAAGLPVLGAH